MSLRWARRATRSSPSSGPSRRKSGRGGADSSGEEVDIPGGETLQALAADMMVAAQKVVEDAEELMAMFPRTERRRVRGGQGRGRTRDR